MRLSEHPLVECNGERWRPGYSVIDATGAVVAEYPTGGRTIKIRRRRAVAG